MTRSQYIKESILDCLSDRQRHTYHEIITHASEHYPSDLEPLRTAHIDSTLRRMVSNNRIYRVGTGIYKLLDSAQYNILLELNELISTIDSVIASTSFEMDQREFAFSKCAYELKKELIQYRTKLSNLTDAKCN